MAASMSASRWMLNQRLVATATDRMYNPANEALGTYEVREQDGVSVQPAGRERALEAQTKQLAYYF